VRAGTHGRRARPVQVAGKRGVGVATCPACGGRFTLSAVPVGATLAALPCPCRIVARVARPEAA
jgi:hypothetical protein